MSLRYLRYYDYLQYVDYPCRYRILDTEHDGSKAHKLRRSPKYRLRPSPNLLLQSQTLISSVLQYHCVRKTANTQPGMPSNAPAPSIGSVTPGVEVDEMFGPEIGQIAGPWRPGDTCSRFSELLRMLGIRSSDLRRYKWRTWYRPRRTMALPVTTVHLRALSKFYQVPGHWEDQKSAIIFQAH